EGKGKAQCRGDLCGEEIPGSVRAEKPGQQRANKKDTGQSGCAQPDNAEFAWMARLQETRCEPGDGYRSEEPTPAPKKRGEGLGGQEPLTGSSPPDQSGAPAQQGLG